MNSIQLGTKGYMIDTRTAAGITSSKVKGGGIEIPTCYPRWKRINRSKDSGPTRYHYLLESYSKVTNPFVCNISNGLVYILRTSYVIKAEMNKNFLEIAIRSMYWR